MYISTQFISHFITAINLLKYRLFLALHDYNSSSINILKFCSLLLVLSLLFSAACIQKKNEGQCEYQMYMHLYIEILLMFPVLGVANLLFKCVFRWTPILVVSRLVSFMLLLGYIRISYTLCISFITVELFGFAQIIEHAHSACSLYMTDELILSISSVGYIRCFI